MIDYYDVLEVSPNANDEVVKKAYHTLVKQYQPEHFHSAYKQYATQRIKLIDEAYQTLSNIEKRRRYDIKLAKHTRIASPLKSRSLLHLLLKITGIAFISFLLLQVVIAILQSVSISGNTLLKVIPPLFVLFMILWIMRGKLRFMKR